MIADKTFVKIENQFRFFARFSFRREQCGPPATEIQLSAKTGVGCISHRKRLPTD
jgi:hypothetical protein